MPASTEPGETSTRPGAPVPLLLTSARPSGATVVAVAIVECVPNVSEGRRADVIAACAEALRGAGVALLDVHSDPIHNRSVFTFAGEAATVRAAVHALFDAALPRIDLRSHQGVHPRLGAVDVVPFVPIEDVTLADCVTLARDVAAEVARRHHLPIYFYEAAATLPARRRLEDVRRGEFEGLVARLKTPEGVPDAGPVDPHASAGASIFGARMPLVAYNINLDTDRLEVAKAIARSIRESSGGMRFVKALGLPLANRGIVQVSMNLTNVDETPVHAVFDRVKREAEAHGVAVIESELVGLIPQSALTAAGAAYLKLAGFSPRQVLEHQIRTARGRA